MPAIAYPRSNDEIADLLEEVAGLLRTQGANPFRVHAWEEGARALRRQALPAVEVLAEKGHAGLVAIPHIGKGLSSAIEELLHTGRLGQLERLRGEVSPEALFTTIGGIGEKLASRIHSDLGVETLEQLEQAAHDGRLAALPGLGHRRVRAIRETLEARLARKAQRRAQAAHPSHGEGSGLPSIALLLEIDRKYREGAIRGTLQRIAPRRFNPTGETWLPILHATESGWHFTAMFSNTARAHALNKTGDWVVIFFERDGDEDQCTVVTEHRGTLAGRRVVRGRERECASVAAEDGFDSRR